MEIELTPQGWLNKKADVALVFVFWFFVCFCFLFERGKLNETHSELSTVITIIWMNKFLNLF